MLRESNMATPGNQNEATDVDRAFQLQIEFLKLEFESINGVIARIDQTTQATKHWAITVWAGAVALMLGKPDLSKHLLLTAILPLIFWFIDAQWRHIQRSCIFRIEQISAFLNDERLRESFNQKRVTGLRLLDPRAKNARGTPEYRDFTSVRRTAGFGEVAPFYLGLSLLSVVAALVVARWSSPEGCSSCPFW
jgi:hypothetical protein